MPKSITLIRSRELGKAKSGTRLALTPRRARWDYVSFASRQIAERDRRWAAARLRRPRDPEPRDRPVQIDRHPSSRQIRDDREHLLGDSIEREERRDLRARFSKRVASALH